MARLLSLTSLLKVTCNEETCARKSGEDGRFVVPRSYSLPACDPGKGKVSSNP